MNSIKVCEYSRSRSFYDDLILQDQASGERSQDHWSSGFPVISSFNEHVCSPDAQMIEYENAAMMPRPEEEREIEREKNRKLAEDLKVSILSLFIPHHLKRTGYYVSPLIYVKMFFHFLS